MRQYYEVETKCGHVGRMNCVWIKYAIVAENAKEASRKALDKGRVKREHPDAIREVRKIDREEFIALRQDNKNDPYLRCTNIQQQRMIVDFDDRVCPDEWNRGKLVMKRKKPDYSYRSRKYELDVEARSIEMKIA